VAQDQVQLVADVHQFPGHIACDSASNSEIVLPIHKDGTVWGVLDIDSPYLNRFTQTTYIPGSIYKIVTLAAALEELPDAEDMVFFCEGLIELDGGEITCESYHGEQSLKEAFANSCNCAFAQLALEIGAEKMEHYVELFGVNESVSFDGIVTPEGNYQASGAAEVDIGWSGAGQYNNLVNPCSFLTFAGAIANGGEGALPYVVENVKVGNPNTYAVKTENSLKRMSQDTARTVAEYMRNNVESQYGDWYFPGLSVCAKTGTAEVGGDQSPHAMLSGFVDDSDYPLAFIVCVENGGYGADVCLPIASQVIAACVDAMDDSE
jgi:peptidoglycan glycosyltransferase